MFLEIYNLFRMEMNSGTILGYFLQAVPITIAVGIVYLILRLRFLTGNSRCLHSSLDRRTDKPSPLAGEGGWPQARRMRGREAKLHPHSISRLTAPLHPCYNTPTTKGSSQRIPRGIDQQAWTAHPSWSCLN